jgi:hypothetical protein
MTQPLPVHDLTPDELAYLAKRLHKSGGSQRWRWITVGDRRMTNVHIRLKHEKVVEATADGGFTSAEIVRECFAAFVRRHKRRSESAKRGARTAAKRRQLLVYEAAEALKNNALTPRTRCRICGRGLEDPASIERGIGSECWDQVLAALTERKEEQREKVEGCA